jgi:DNA-binding HxlR family transcriptional regulator
LPVLKTRNLIDAISPTRDLLGQIGDKWSMLVLIALSTSDFHFNALTREISGITQKLLVQTLRKLERNGLVSRTVNATRPVTVSYSITPLGAPLAFMLVPIQGWAITNIRKVKRARDKYDAPLERIAPTSRKSVLIPLPGDNLCRS